MRNQSAVEEFKRMSLKQQKEFLDAHEQETFADNSKVRLFCKKHYPEAYSHGLTFALSMMYIDLSYALHEVLNDIIIGYSDGLKKSMKKKKKEEKLWKQLM